MSLAIYPGTFDPVTMGHLDILERASNLFDQVIVAVADDNNKATLFDLEERKTLIRGNIMNREKVRVMSFRGLTVAFARENNAVALIRGLRAMSDYEYELQLAMMNKKFAPEIETIFLMAQGDYSFISSSSIKWAASLGGDIAEFVPENVAKALYGKFQKTI